MSGADVPWVPSPSRVEASRMLRFARWLAARHGVDIESYQQLWRFSVDRPAEFWCAVWDFFDVAPSRALQAGEAVSGSVMPDVHWFEGERVNYAQNALRHPSDRLAVVRVDDRGDERRLTYGELASEVAAAAAGLRRLGVGRGDRVAAILPNREEALVGLLAAASIGAIWALCAPELGHSSIVSRLAQIEPRVVISTDAYVYGRKVFDQRAKTRDVLAELPSVEAHVVVASGEHLVGEGGGDQMGWDELTADRAAPLIVEPVPFEHPLWVLYSSGTTGIPKAMMHSHGGIVLEHLKNIGLHTDVQPGDVFFWYTTTAWMMWNFQVGGLLVGATVVLYDGPPTPERVWPIVANLDVDIFGASPGFFEASRISGTHQRGSALRTLGSTGAPLPESNQRWMTDTFGPDVHVASVSGGTDVCSGFVGPHPWGPVTIGRMQGPMLGVRVEAYDSSGRSLVGRIGELVVTAPMPSMPLGFWGDDGTRLRAAYFEQFPGVWRHGDWAEIFDTGEVVIHGRSDSTLNRGGVRTGTSEFYRALEAVPDVADALVVDTSRPDGSEGELLLFVVVGPDVGPDLERRVAAAVRTELSPRHVPDRVLVVPEVPYTLTGKKSEVPVKRILQGALVDTVVDVQSLRNPAALQQLLDVFYSSNPPRS